MTTINKTKERKVENNINCNCGNSYRRSNKSNHLKTKKHINYFNSLAPIDMWIELNKKY